MLQNLRSLQNKSSIWAIGLPDKVFVKIKAPKIRKELRQFIGIVNYYRNMWFCRSELLAPLTSLTSRKVKFEWLSTHQQAFEKIKKVIGIEVIVVAN